MNRGGATRTNRMTRQPSVTQREPVAPVRERVAVPYEQPDEEQQEAWHVQRGVVAVGQPRQPVVRDHEVLHRDLGRQVQELLQVIDLTGAVDRTGLVRERQLTRKAPDRVEARDQAELEERRQQLGADPRGPGSAKQQPDDCAHDTGDARLLPRGPRQSVPRHGGVA